MAIAWFYGRSSFGLRLKTSREDEVAARSIGIRVERERRIAGIDWKVSYVPLQNNQFRRFDWGTEVLYSDSRYLFDPDGIAGNGDEYYGNVGSLGLYSYVTYKWHRQWSAGLLFDWVENPQNNQDRTVAYSPLHHVGVEPLESTPAPIHAHGPQCHIRAQAR